MKSLPPALNAIKELLQGKGLVSHPLHVAINHMPLGLWEGSVIFDLLSRQRKWRKLSEGGYYLNAFGIIAAVPTAATGLAEWWDIPSDHPGWKVATTHAVLNDVALMLSLYNWWTRRSRHNHAPDHTNLLVSGALVGVLGLSGYLGGVIAHEYGYGTHRQGSSIDKEHESLVGPQAQISQAKTVYTAAASTDSSLDSLAGIATDEVRDTDTAVENAMLDPGSSREIDGTGI